MKKKCEEAKPVTIRTVLGRMWILIGDDQWIVYLRLGGSIIAVVSEISIPSILAMSIFSAESRAAAEFHRNAHLLIMLCISSGVCRLSVLEKHYIWPSSFRNTSWRACF